MAAGLIGCAVETSLTEKTVKTEEGDALEGVPTYATFSWAVDDADLPTRSGGTMENDGGATAEGKKITDIRLLVFNATSTTVCEVNRVFTDASVADSRVTLGLNAGAKRVFVITNTGSSPLGTILNTVTPGTTTFQQFCAMMYDLNLNTATDASTPLSVPAHIDGLAHLINPSTGFVMSNRIDITSRLYLRANVDSMSSVYAGSTENNFTIRVQRAVAKVGIRLASAGAQTTADGMSTVVAPKFMLRNVNRAIYPFQQFSSVEVDASSYGILPISPYFDDNEYTDVAKHYFSYTAWEPLETAFTKSYYVTENTSWPSMYRNTTYAAIEAVFLPKAGAVVTNDPNLVAPAPGALKYDPLTGRFEGATYNTDDITVPPATLYRLHIPDNYYPNNYGFPPTTFFTSRELAYRVAYIIRMGSESGWNPASMESLIETYELEDLIEEYSDGRCYYRVLFGRSFLMGSNGGQVCRNYAYTITIDSFESVGVSELTDDIQVESGETFVTTRVEMEDWNNGDNSVVVL
jgi:hypothetical protein